MIELRLPYPPSVNTLWRRRGRRYFLSKKGQLFRAAVFGALANMHYKPLEGDVAVEIEVAPPDRLRRDIDNIIKIILDSLQLAKVFHDDSQVSSLRVKRVPRGPQGSGGYSIVRIRGLDHHDHAQ
jgi:crossover junction endodeoxyribonuclease RusA